MAFILPTYIILQQINNCQQKYLKGNAEGYSFANWILKQNVQLANGNFIEVTPSQKCEN